MSSLYFVVDPRGVEPPRSRLKGGCSTIELRVPFSWRTSPLPAARRVREEARRRGPPRPLAILDLCAHPRLHAPDQARVTPQAWRAGLASPGGLCSSQRTGGCLLGLFPWQDDAELPRACREIDRSSIRIPRAHGTPLPSRNGPAEPDPGEGALPPAHLIAGRPRPGQTGRSRGKKESQKRRRPPRDPGRPSHTSSDDAALPPRSPPPDSRASAR